MVVVTAAALSVVAMIEPCWLAAPLRARQARQGPDRRQDHHGRLSRAYLGMTSNRLFLLDNRYPAKNVIPKYDTLFKILSRLFNALAEPQVCVTCPSFLPSFAGVVSEDLAGSEITAQGGLPARGQPPRVGAIWRHDRPLEDGLSQLKRRRAP